MALRILSGMLFIDGGPKSGSATISFNPLQLTAAPPTVSLRKARTAGAPGDFVRSPASIVSARQFSMVVVSDGMRLGINDTVSRTEMTISWRGKGAMFSEEIPFLVAGDVPDLIPVRLPPKVTPVRPGIRIPRRRKASRKRR